MELLVSLLGIMLFCSIIAIIIGIIQLISSKGERGLKYILGGIIAAVVALIIGFGSCVIAFNS